MNELVSIIMPLYNSDRFIGDAIRSVLSQTYNNWELFVVDDCSTDNSVLTVENIIAGNRSIRFIKLKKNVGSAQARNYALDLINGRFVAFLDSDDIWSPTKLVKQVEFMLNKNTPISFTSYEIVGEDGLSKNKIVRSVDRLNQSGYLKNTIIGFSTSMIDTSIVGKDFKMMNIRTRQDTSLWITLLGKGFVAHGLDMVLVKYRTHSNSISANKIKAALQVWHLYYSLHRIGLFKSIYCFTFYAFNAVKKRIFHER